MAVIAQSNPYQGLSRKIGYSVGLENVVRNATMLVDAWSSKARTFKISDWNALVREGFGRNESAAEHIANFFTSLNLIKVFGNEVHALYGLDALLMLRARYADREDLFQCAVRLVLLQLIVEADGDIFLNCLHARFDRDVARDEIAQMVSEKWSAVRSNIANVQAQDRLWDVIAIRSLPAGPAKESSTGGPFARRTQPLKVSALRQSAKTRTVEVHDSYLDKVLPTRKGWAKDLHLVDQDDLTPSGAALLDNLRSIGIAGDGAYRFWPYQHDLAKLRLSATDLGAKAVTAWELLQQLIRSYGGLLDPSLDEDKCSEVAVLLKELHALYKAASPAQGSIRHQLPIYVAKPVVGAIYLAERRPLIDLPACIEHEIHKESGRRFDVTNVRGTEGALIFR